MAEDVRTRTCDDCGEEFRTLTALRSHDCPGPSSERFDVDEEIAYLDGTLSVKASGTVPDRLADVTCARCEDQATTQESLRPRWRDELQARGEYEWTATSWEIPLCPPCGALASALAEAEKSYGRLDPDGQVAIDEERARFVAALDVGQFIQLEL
jgi:Zn finger protein HypA/HybF involved in hydrogenase expression